MPDSEHPRREARTHVRSEDFRNLDSSGMAIDAIASMDELHLDPFITHLKRRSFELVGASPGAKILDVGCGAGDDAIAMARIVRPGGAAAGVDLSEAMVVEARRRSQAAGLEIDFQVSSAAQLPYPNDWFDGVRCERTLQHVEDPEAVLMELVRVLRPGGTVVAIDSDRGVFALDFAGWDADVEFRLGRWGASGGGVRNGLFSRRVRRRLIEIGLQNVVAHPWVNTSTAELQRRPHLVEERCARAVAAGAITETEAKVRVRAVRSAFEDGTLQITTLFWMTVGTKPIGLTRG
ncbi:MAG: methyltransferase domain-containing protein [Anaerolineaceae bacterium]